MGAHSRVYDSFEYDGPVEQDPSSWCNMDAGIHMPAMDDFWEFSAKTYNTPLIGDPKSLAVALNNEIAAKESSEKRCFLKLII